MKNMVFPFSRTALVYSRYGRYSLGNHDFFWLLVSLYVSGCVVLEVDHFLFVQSKNRPPGNYMNEEGRGLPTSSYKL